MSRFRPADPTPAKEPILKDLEELDQDLEDDSDDGKAVAAELQAPLVRVLFRTGLSASTSSIRLATSPHDRSPLLRC